MSEIFRPDFLEILATAKTPNMSVLPPIRSTNELFNHPLVTDTAENELLINKLGDVSMSVAARANYYGLEENAKLRRTGRKPEGWIVWAEQLDDPKTAYTYGQVFGTILCKDGLLRNIDPVVINQRDVPSSLENPLERLDVLARIVRRTKQLNEIDFSVEGLSYDQHINHLAEFMVKHQLDRPQQRLSSLA